MPEAKPTYLELLEKCAATRADIDERLHKRYNEIKKAFEEVFPEYKGIDFKRFVDLVYYQGGYPSPNSPPKEEDLADLVSKSLQLERAYGRTTLEELLEERGVTVKVDASTVPKSSKQIQWLKTNVKECLGLQAEICSLANSIKKTGAKTAKTTFKIDRDNFIKAVKIAAIGKRKGIKTKDKKVIEAYEKGANLVDAIEPLE